MRSHIAIACLLATASVTAQSGWSAPTLVTELNTSAADTAPHISIDGSTLHFASYGSGNWEIWSAVRPARGLPFGTPVIETVLNSSSTESGPFLSANGLELVFESLRSGGLGGFDLMRATRPTPIAPWGPPSFITELNSSGSEASASMTADGTELYMLSTGWGAPYAPNNSIFVAHRANAASPWGAPTVVAELAATQGASDSHRDVEVSPDGLRVFFTRYESALRRLNVYEARRTSRAAPFGTPVMLTEFSSVGTLSGVYSASVSADGSEMFLAAGFATTAGSQELLISRFEGLSASGIAGTSGAMDLRFRDSTSPGAPFAFALSGGNTGFALGARTIPLDADAIFLGTLGVDVTGISSGFLGTLDAQGETVARLRNPAPYFAGLHLWVGAFAFDASAPFGVKTISNAIEVELH